MHKPNDLSRIRHMHEAAAKAIDFTANRQIKTLEDNELLLLGLVRLLEIIGEAAGCITDGFKGRYPYVPWIKIKGMRNRLIHGYFDFDPILVWKTIEDDLPGLVAELEKIIMNEV
ncbi:MAG: DUF86 domain-containing protein [Dehalococcoidaceae bacterium]|nr:DUF86 domain-containing protein [Dehalococcoidaceae bacterium]